MFNKFKQYQLHFSNVCKYFVKVSSVTTFNDYFAKGYYILNYQGRQGGGWKCNLFMGEDRLTEIQLWGRGVNQNLIMGDVGSTEI